MTVDFRSAGGRKVADALGRSDLLSFTDLCLQELQGGDGLKCSWHLELIAAELTSVAAGTSRRLLINLPPRHLKSILCSVAFPAWLLGRDPEAQIICVSYGHELAEKFSRDCRQIMMSDWYQRLFPGTRLSASKNTSAEFQTTRGGVRLATSTGGVLTGRGADYIIIDDPLKASDAYSEAQREAVNNWYSQTLLSRLNNKRTGALIVVMQRLHEDDLSGVLLGRGGFRHIRLPAIATEDEAFSIDTLRGPKRVGRKAGAALHPERESLEILQTLQREVGESIFSAQYQQDPMPAAGNMIKSAWLKYYAPDELPEKFDTIIQSWDTANKLTDGSDYSVCTTWGSYDKHLYLLHVLRERLDFPTLRATAISHQKAYQANTILIEDKASGTPLLQELRSNRMYCAKGVEPVSSKSVRMHGQTVLFENGTVLLPKAAPWLSDYLRELTAFPNGKHDDQVDSTSQALDWFNARLEQPGILIYYQNMVEEKRAKAQGAVG